MQNKTPKDFNNPECSNVDINIFFESDPEDFDKRIADANYQEAKKICMGCEHRVDCADWGIKNEIHGMWGGFTPRERQKLRKARGLTVPIEFTIKR